MKLNEKSVISPLDIQDEKTSRVLSFLVALREEEKELKRRADEHAAQLRVEDGLGYE